MSVELTVVVERHLDLHVFSGIAVVFKLSLRCRLGDSELLLCCHRNVPYLIVFLWLTIISARRMMAEMTSPANQSSRGKYKCSLS